MITKFNKMAEPKQIGSSDGKAWCLIYLGYTVTSVVSCQFLKIARFHISRLLVRL